MNANIGLVIMILLFMSCKSDEKKDILTPSSQPISQALTVNAIIAQKTKTNENINTTGSIIANEERELRSEISGKIKGIYFKEGTYINKGQLQ